MGTFAFSLQITIKVTKCNQIKPKFIEKPKGDSWNRMDDPRLFDPNETKKIIENLKNSNLSEYGKKIFGFDYDINKAM